MTDQTLPLPRLEPHLIYGLDAAASLVLGVALLFTADLLTSLAGWTLPPAFLWTIGALLLPWSAFNFWVARSPAPPRGAVLGNIVGDIAWVIGTIALLVQHAPDLTGLGLLMLAGQGLAVGGVLLIKLVGARALLG